MVLLLVVVDVAAVAGVDVVVGYVAGSVRAVDVAVVGFDAAEVPCFVCIESCPHTGSLSSLVPLVQHMSRHSLARA